MPRINRIVCGWYGTLTRDENDEALWDFVTKKAWRRSWNPGRLLNIALAEREWNVLKDKAVEEGNGEKYKTQQAFYDILNNRVLKGLSTQVFHRALNEYCESAKTRLYTDVLNAITSLRGIFPSGEILSTGCKDEIELTLSTTSYRLFFEGHVRANIIEFSKERKFVNKFEYLGIKKMNEFTYGDSMKKMKAMVYIGGEPDDIPYLEIVSQAGGNPIVSIYASDEFKQEAAEKAKAFVPKDIEELKKILRGA